MNEPAGFSLSVSQDKYVSAQTREIHAIIRVSAAGVGAAAAEGSGPSAAEIIIVDCSESMAYPPAKLDAAINATCAALDTLRDDVLFAVVAGNGFARLVYPGRPALVPASAVTRAEAKKAVRSLYASDGTRIGRWLEFAAELFEEHPGIVRHAMLYTDGKNQHESPQELGKSIERCQGRFDCDARGIGDGWDPAELRRIAAALHGRADAVPDFAEGLADDFRGVMREAMRKAVPEVALRVRPGRGVAVKFVRQTYPTMSDLTGLAVPVDRVAADYPTGAWGEDTRDFHICLTADRGDRPVGKDHRLARVEVMTGEAGSPRTVSATEERYVSAHWTDRPPGPSHLTHPMVEHYARQQDLGEAVREGCHSYQDGDHERARGAWGRAVAIAYSTGNLEVLARLRNVVEIIDAASGDVRLRPDGSITKQDINMLDVASDVSSMSMDSRQAIPRAPVAAAPEISRTCPDCGRISPPGALVCEQCGHSFHPGAAGEATQS